MYLTLILGFTHKKDSSYYFTFSDLYFHSNYHPDGLMHVTEALCKIQCPSNPDDSMFISLEVNGTEITDLHDVAAILMFINGACSHTSMHNYCNSIAKYAQSGIPEYLARSSIIQNMIAAVSGLNVAANW